jgi:hypothetical protein
MTGVRRPDREATAEAAWPLLLTGDRRKDCSAYVRTEPIMHAAPEDVAEDSAHGSVAQGRIIDGLSSSAAAATAA